MTLLNPYRFGAFSAFNPSDYGTVLQWLNPNDISGVDGDSIPTWTASVGQNATQTDSAKRPILKIISGQKYLRFDGSNDFMQTSNLSPSTTGLTLFLVAKNVPATNHVLTELSNNFNSNNRAFVLYVNATRRYEYAHLFSSVYNNQRFSASQPADVVLEATGNFSLTGNETFIWANGVAGDTRDLNGDTVSGNYGSFPLVIASRGGVNNFTSADIGDILIYSGVLSSTNRQAVREHLASKYAISL